MVNKKQFAKNKFGGATMLSPATRFVLFANLVFNACTFT